MEYKESKSSMTISANEYHDNSVDQQSKSWDAAAIIGYRVDDALPNGVAISDETLKGTYHLFEGPVSNLRPMQSRQDEELAARISKASSTPLPKIVKPGEFVAVPLDIMAYSDPKSGQLRFACLEFNTIGYSGIFCLPELALRAIRLTFCEIGKTFHSHPGALFLVASSGRQKPTDPLNPEKLKYSITIHEKVWFADSISEGSYEASGDKKSAVVSFHDPKAFEKWATAPDSPWNTDSKGSILVGYTCQFVESPGMEIVDGIPYFYGRRVFGMVNDRFISNLQAAHGKLDPRKFLSCNITSHIGTDKFAAYTAINNYNKEVGRNFASCTRDIPAEYGNNVEELVSKVQSFLRAGMRAIIKPNNTGWGHGIQAYVDLHESEEDIREKIHKSISEVNENYNKKQMVAGFPYTITEYLDANTINSPDEISPYHYAHGCKYEMRIAVYADYSEEIPLLKACPAYIKLQLVKSAQVCNISTQMEKTGRPDSDFMLPLCTSETLELLGLSEKQVTELCKWATGYVAHVLEKTKVA